MIILPLGRVFGHYGRVSVGMTMPLALIAGVATTPALVYDEPDILVIFGADIGMYNIGAAA